MYELHPLKQAGGDQRPVFEASTEHLLPEDSGHNNEPTRPIETPTDDRADGEVRVSQPPMFTPTWLKVSSLGSFLAVILVSMITLGIIYHVAQVQNGYPIRSGDEYSWKYGPTVVFVLLGGLWRQVDYWCKTLGPWQALHEQWTDSDHSLMLDYVGQIQVFASWSALKRKHWAVFSSIMGVLLLRVMTAISTGIFTVQETQITHGSVPVLPSNDPIDAVFRNQTSRYTRQGPFETYYGVLNQGLQFPAGISDSFTVQTFEAKDSLPSGTTKLAANVTGFWPHLQCQEGSVSWKVIANATDVVQLSFETADGLCSLGAPINVTLLDRQRNILPDRLVFPRMMPAIPDCQGQSVSTTHLFFAVIDASYQQHLLPDAQKDLESHIYPPVIARSSSMQVEAITGALCSQHFDFKTAYVEIDPSDARSQSGPGLRATPLEPSDHNPLYYGKDPDGAKTWNELLFTFLKAERHRFGQDFRLDTSTAAWFRLMLPEQDIDDYIALLNSDQLMERAKATFAPLMALHLDFVVSDPSYVSLGPRELLGKAVSKEDRLFVQVEPLVVMESCLCLMACMVIIIMVFGPRKVVPRSPDSIGVMATFLAGSHSLTQLLKHSGHWNDAAIKETLSGQRFRTRVGHGEGQGHTFSLEVESDSEKLHQEETPRAKKSYWKPMGDTIPFRIMMMVVAPLLVILLAVLQSLSKQPSGILEVPNNTSSNLFSRYIPAVIMLCTSIMYGTFGAGILSLAPYRVLSRGSLSQQRSIFANYTRDIPVITLWKATLHRQLPIIFSVLTMLAASFLTILVPALYQIDTNSPESYNTTVYRSDLFNLTWGGDGWWDNGAAVTQELIELSNMTFPSFTYNDLAFPALQLPDLGERVLNETNRENSHMTVRIPALRPRLDCTVLDSTTLLPLTSSNGSSTTIVQTTIDLPRLYPDCVRGGVYGNTTELRFNRTIPFPSIEPVYAGHFTDLHVGPVPRSEQIDALYHQYVEMGMTDAFNTEYMDQDYGVYQPYTNFYGGQNPDGCPSVGIIFGYFTPDSTDTTNTTTGICDQVIEEVMTEATFFLPSLDLDLSHPPIPDESTSHVLGNGRGFDTHQYRPEFHMTGGLPVFITSMRLLLSPFYQVAMFGVNGVPAAEMTGPDHVQRLLNRTSEVYSTYMALAISSKMRQPVGDPTHIDYGTPESRSIKDQDDSQAFQARVVQPRSVLRQDRTSSIILQAFLAFTFVCSAIASFLTWKAAPLMHDPGSIAGVASLVAGSEIASRTVVPEGTEWLSTRDMVAEGLFEGMRFQMGWREEEEENENRRIYRIHAT